MFWPTKKLGELEDEGIIKLGRGKVISKKDLVENPGDYPVYSASRLNQGEFGRYGKYMFDEELITWSIDGGGNFFYRPKHKFSVTNVCGWLRILKPEVLDYKYLYFTLDLIHKRLYFNYIFKAHPSVIRDKYEIPLPPLEIQKRIVARIEELFEKIDKAKQLREKALEETENIFPLTLEHIFRKAEKKYKKQKIEEILELNQSGIWGDEPTDLKNSYPIIRSTEITYEGKLKLDSVVFRKVNKEKVDKYVLHEGDILIVKSSGSPELIGRCTLFRHPKEDKKIYLFSNFIQRLRPNAKIVTSEFLYYFLNFEGKKFVQYLMTTTTGLRNLPIKQYVKLEIPLPPLSEQKKIVAYLDNLREKIEKLKQLQQKQLEELTELKNSILEKAFKEELL